MKKVVIMKFYMANGDDRKVVVPFETEEEAEAYAKEISNELANDTDDGAFYMFNVADLDGEKTYLIRKQYVSYVIVKMRDMLDNLPEEEAPTLPEQDYAMDMTVDNNVNMAKIEKFLAMHEDVVRNIRDIEVEEDMRKVRRNRNPGWSVRSREAERDIDMDMDMDL